MVEPSKRPATKARFGAEGIYLLAPGPDVLAGGVRAGGAVAGDTRRGA
jgi:hypothetical protein